VASASKGVLGGEVVSECVSGGVVGEFFDVVDGLIGGAVGDCVGAEGVGLWVSGVVSLFDEPVLDILFFVE
jgi:hypothetical protein